MLSAYFYVKYSVIASEVLVFHQKADAEFRFTAVHKCFFISARSSQVIRCSAVQKSSSGCERFSSVGINFC